MAKVNIESLTQLYRNDSAAKAALDYFSSRQRNRRTTIKRRLRAVLRRNGVSCSSADIIRIFKALENAGCGRYIVGRHTQETRFEWAVGMINVGKAAKGEDVESVDEAVTYFDDESNGRLIHHYRLREDFEVKVELPKNFNPSEAERFANFVKTLPFGA